MLNFNILQKDRNFQSYFTAFFIIVCLYFTFALIFDLFQIHIYRHDAVYYLHWGYLPRLRTEGRWINYLLFPIISIVPGKLASFLNLLFLFLFALVSCYRWTKNITYAFLVSLLIVQVAPFIAQILWPATSMSAFFILFLAALVSRSIPIYLFYAVFGILFFGAISNLYYLLPLLHLNLLNRASLKQNLKELVIRVLPAWALGFVIGYLFALLVIFTITGQFGIEIANWRKPNYVHDLQDLTGNIGNSFEYLYDHITRLLDGVWRNAIMAMALITGLISVKKYQYIPLVLLSVSITLAHYIITIPVGIVISFRTAIAAWIGVLVLIFFYPEIKKWQYFILLPIIALMNYSLFKENHESLHWYASITNIHFNELLRVTPLPPPLYSGVIFLSSDEEVRKVNSMISKKLHLTNGGRLAGLGTADRWSPVGYEAGFKEVILCNSAHQHAAVCNMITMNNKIDSTSNISTSGMYKILGQQNDYLIISLNNQVNI
jgi:hypothetical protein